MDLDILGQQPGLSSLYTQLCYCFRISDDSQRPMIIDTLTSGLGILSESFPWIAGQVVHDSLEDDNRGIFRVRALASSPKLFVVDHVMLPTLPTMDELRHQRFPMSLLNENIIAPINTIAAGSAAVSDSSPVMVIQASFIVGGLLLTLVTQHNIMDMTGMGQILSLLSRACHNDPFTEEEIRIGNIDRLSLIPLLEESYKPGPELFHQIKNFSSDEDNDNVGATEPNSSLSSFPSSCSWVYVTFSADALNSLKSVATESLPPHASFVSTDDVLSAFLWQSILRVRQHRIHPTVKSTFMRAVDPRRYLNIPESYPGLVQNMVYHSYPVEDLVNASLGEIAAVMRQTVDPQTSTIGYSTQALVTHYYKAKDRSGINVTANFKRETDLMISSWSKVACSELDFNLGLGVAECVRRPSFIPVEGLLYLMPKAADGEVAVALCLRDDDIASLRLDELFNKYGFYVG